MNSVGVTIRKHWRLLVFILGLVLICWLLWALRSVIIPFVIGFIIAYVLLPIIKWIEKHLSVMSKKPQLKRVIIIVAIYILAGAVIGLTIFYLSTVMGKAMSSLAQDAPQIIPNSIAMITQRLKSLPIFSPVSIQQQIDGWALKASDALGNALKGFVAPGVVHLKGSSGLIFGFISMPIFTFLIMRDWDKLSSSIQAKLPTWAATHTKGIFSIIQTVTGRYIRSQLFLGLVIGLCTGAMLFIMKIEFALPLAIFAGITEMVPMIGPLLGAGLAVLITLSTAPEMVIWVALGCAIIQLLENTVIVPKIQSSQMQIHPAFVIMLGILGGHFGGTMGFIIVMPLTMTILAIFKYLWGSARDGGIK